ncbi:MAG TPA: ribose-phosphate diphosphokinase [Azospirillaceae bacterium]|nr:ribose-phosphate diphosphokinase [Azospirillaceae bacterium]
MPFTAPDLVIGFPDSEPAAAGLARAMGLPLSLAALHRFPDGESLVRLEGAPRHPVIVRALDRPNDKLVELHFLADALRERGAGAITLVAPYLAYMRQDMEFRPGEVVSQRVMGRWLSGLVDRIVTVEPHLHRTDDLAHVFPGREAHALTAAPLIGAWAKAEAAREGGDWIVLGPDEESGPLVDSVARAAGLTGLVARKERRGDRDVTVTLPDGADIRGATVLLVDDVISSGGTMIDAARAATAAGAGRLLAAATHALYDERAADAMRAAGIARVISCDGVAHPSNAIPLADLLLGALGH